MYDDEDSDDEEEEEEEELWISFGFPRYSSSVSLRSTPPLQTAATTPAVNQKQNKL